MNKFKISTRLMAMVVCMALVMVAIGVMGLASLAKTNEGLKTVYEDRTVPLGQMLQVQRLMLRNRFTAVLPLVYPDKLQESLQAMEKGDVEIDKVWAAYKATELTTREAELARSFEENRAAYNAAFLKPAMDALRAGDLKRVRELVDQKDLTLFPRIRDDINALSDLQSDVARQEFEASQQRYAATRSMSLMAVAFGVVLAGAFGFVLVRGIRRSLDAARAAADAVAAGDLTHEVRVEGEDEIAVMMRSMATMRDALVQVVSSVREGSDGVAIASSQIAQGNQDLSARTEKQASAIQETSASMEQLGTTVKQNADHAKAASQLAAQAADVAGRGGAVVAEVVSTIREISESSGKIADIINVIDGIAFQTNILALNAAVEAARAGEQGRGFAVVASEVRNLAQRSADAAKEIKGLITDSVQRVEKGTDLADKAGATMGEVVTSVQRVNQLIAEISGASQQQSAGVSQVGEAVVEMDQVTQQNAALVEEMAAAAKSLSGQAQDLVKAVSVFRLAGHGPTASLAPVQRVQARIEPAVATRRLAVRRPALGVPSAAVSAPRPALATAGAADASWESF